jgi:hypothetical protein
MGTHHAAKVTSLTISSSLAGADAYFRRQFAMHRRMLSKPGEPLRASRYPLGYQQPISGERFVPWLDTLESKIIGTPAVFNLLPSC